MTWGHALSAASPATVGSENQDTGRNPAGGPAKSTSRASSPDGKAGSPLGVLIDARAPTATAKGLRGLYRRQHQILAKGSRALIVTFPWPPAKLSPNARLSPFEKARAVKAYRTGCAWEATAAGLRKIEAGPLRLTITFAPPDARRRDLDNMLASLKPGLDGLSDVLGVDDYHWTLTITRAAPVERGAVSITIARPVAAEAVTIPLKGPIS